MMQQNNEKHTVTVIVPTYNTGKYVKRCYQSIKDSDSRNIRIIFIDDGSQDDTLNILRSIESGDNAVTVLSQNNTGVSYARNVALDYYFNHFSPADNDWITFVDSDDYIDPSMISSLLAAALSNHTDIAMCTHINVKQAEIQAIPHASNFQFLRCSTHEFMEKLLPDNQKIHSYPWAKLYRSCLWKSIRFPKFRYYAQDLMIMHHVIEQANAIACTQEPFYCYFESRNDNISNKKNNRAKGALDRAIAFYDRYEFSITKYPKVCDELLKRAVEFSCSGLVYAFQFPADKANEINRTKSYIQTYRKQILSNKSIALQWRLLSLVLSHFN